MTTKWCSRCRQERPEDEFSELGAYCRPCGAAYARAWRAKYPDRVRAAKARHVERNPDYNRKRLLSRHGLTIERFNELLEAQDNACAICRTTAATGNGWHIDHDHSCCATTTGKRCGKCFRGILCGGCNTGLGFFQDDPARLRGAAVSYLEAA